jgi:transposase
MAYSSSFTDKEWEIIEPLLLEVLPQKKQTRPSEWTKREILDGILYQLKNGRNWNDLLKELPPYSTVYWHYKQWRSAKVIEKLMTVLVNHSKVQFLCESGIALSDVSHGY